MILKYIYRKTYIFYNFCGNSNCYISKTFRIVKQLIAIVKKILSFAITSVIEIYTAKLIFFITFAVILI